MEAGAAEPVFAQSWRRRRRRLTIVLEVDSEDPVGDRDGKNMNRVRTAHFIGIAGAGMGPTAKLLRDSGIKVSGSDADIYPPMSDFLREQNIPCRTPYAPE